MSNLRLAPECREIDGLRVIVLSDHSFPVVSVYSIVDVGSADEPGTQAGISHFVEHLLFKGTSRRPVGSMGQEIMKAGGEINGFTTFDYTGYTITIDSSKLDLALDIHADALSDSSFNASEIKKERSVILEEVKMGETSPSYILQEEMMRRIFPNDPYGRPIIGYRKTVKGMSREDLTEYFRAHYFRENMAVIIVGDVSVDDAVSLAARRFTGVPPGKGNGKDSKLSGTPSFGGACTFEKRMNVNDSYLKILMPGVALNNPDYPALSVLGTILGAGKCGRLAVNIRYPGIASSIGFSPAALKRSGFLSLSATCQPHRASELADSIFREMAAAVSDPMEDAELERAKRMILASSVYDMDTFSERASYQAHYVAMADPHFDAVYLDAVENMKMDTVRDCAARYLKPECAILGRIVPRKGLKPVDVPDRRLAVNWKMSRPQLPVSSYGKWEHDNEVKKTTLANGLTFLYKENRELPLVSCRLLFKAGTSHEHGLRSGLSLMTQQMLLKGSAGRNLLETSCLTESLGIDMAGSTRPDEAGIYSDSLSREIDTALVLMRDAAASPTFQAEEFEMQRAEMITRVRREKDNMMSFTSRLGSRLLWQDHPYSRSPSGEEEDLAGMTLEDVRGFHDRFYRPEKAVLSIVGDIGAEEALAKVDAVFGGLKPGKGAGDGLPAASPLDAPVSVVEKKDWPAAALALGWRCPSILDEDSIPLQVLGSVLGNPFGSRIWKNVREERGLAYAAGAFYYPAALGGSFCLYAGVRPSKILMVRDLLLQQLEKVRKEPVTEEELSDSKAYITGSHRLHRQSASQIADYLALYEISGLGYMFDEEYCDRISAVTARDLMRAAGDHLDKDNFVTLIVKPKARILSILKMLLNR